MDSSHSPTVVGFPTGPHCHRLSCVFKIPVRGDVGSCDPTVRPNLKLKSTPHSHPDPALDASTILER